MINDLLIEQEVLKLQDKLFTCKIKEHNEIIVQIGLNREQMPVLSKSAALGLLVKQWIY